MAENENESEKPKTLNYVIAFCVAFFGPILYFSSSNWWTRASETLSDTWSSSSGADAVSIGLSSTNEPFSEKVSETAVSTSELEPVYYLEEVLRFDITPTWIRERWPCVTCGLAHLQLQGYRVPLVTGTSENDLAGALTYYFNSHQQVQRITIQGTSGDMQHIVYLVTSRYGLTRRLTNDPGHFVYDLRNRDNNPTSFLWIRPAGFVDTRSPHDRFHVALSLERVDN